MNNFIAAPVQMNGLSKAVMEGLARLGLVSQKTTAPHVVISDHDKVIHIQLSDHDRPVELRKPVRLGSIIDEVVAVWRDHNQSQRDRSIAIGAAVFDPRAMIWQRGLNKMTLTEKEVAMLQALLHAHPHALSRDDILQSVWQYHQDATTHTVETHFWRLRQKIEIDPANPDIILTVPEGYRLNGII